MVGRKPIFVIRTSDLGTTCAGCTDVFMKHVYCRVVERGKSVRTYSNVEAIFSGNSLILNNWLTSLLKTRTIHAKTLDCQLLLTS